MDFSPEHPLNSSEAEAIARGLYAIAQCDGVHEQEAALIASFWADTDGRPDALTELEQKPLMPPAELAEGLPGAEVRALFVKTALLLAWADGVFSESERKLVGEYATALGISDAEVQAFEAHVKEFLLSHLTHLQNSASAAKVAQKLGI